MYMSTRVPDALPAPGCPLAGLGFGRARLRGTSRLTFGAARHGESAGIRLGHQALPTTSDFSVDSPSDVTTSLLAGDSPVGHHARK